jgi:alpha-glucosidase
VTRPWWREAVCYQVYIRSFADGNGDGVGDFPGITSRLPYLRDLGVDALWITPFYPSPQADHGYDVADYRDVDPLFGDLRDFDTMLATAHELGLKVIVDVVPAHTSADHPWFKEAVASPPGSAARDRYIFRPGRGKRPPNNYRSIFGGSAWDRIDDEWFLHMFDSSQPDLNWRNPEVAAELESVLAFWLDRGVDGFRIDVAHGLFKPADLSDVHRSDPLGMWDQPEVHEVYRSWRRLLDTYPGERMAVAEAFVETPESMARYIRPDELHQAFNFHWLGAKWSAAAFRRVIDQSLQAVDLVNGHPTWVLSNHDVVRHVTRYGGGELGVSRGRAALLTMLALPGSSYVYEGEELGLEQVDVPEASRQDPEFIRTGKGGRDGCRVPIPWSGTKAPFGFGPGRRQPWLPQPDDWSDLTVKAQTGKRGSTLEFYRAALAARRTHVVGSEKAIHWLPSAPGSLAFRRGDLICALNCGTRPVRIPDGAGDLVISSGAVGDMLPANTAAWWKL